MFVITKVLCHRSLAVVTVVFCAEVSVVERETVRQLYHRYYGLANVLMRPVRKKIFRFAS